LDAEQPKRMVPAENDILNLPRLTSDFCSVRALDLAPRLLGMILARQTPEGLTAGRIIEVEAYEGPEDRACHAFGGRRTARNEVMYGPPGRAYVYFAYGMHWMLNVVAASEGIAHAVLIRSIEPFYGTELMARRRNGMMPLAEGPARLCQALAITGADNGVGLTEEFRGSPGTGLSGAGRQEREIFIAKPPDGMDEQPPYLVTKRVGVGNSGEAKHWPWRFVVKGTLPAKMKVDYPE
jgi:DNA-3-methyladenine glycosylase